MTFRILVVDDHEIVRKGVCALLTSQPGWEICGEAGDGREAMRQIQTGRPDVVILDIGMPNLNGLEATRKILKTHPNTKILILTLHGSAEIIREVVQSGARGLLLKTDAARDLVAAVTAVQQGITYFAPALMEMAGLSSDSSDAPRVLTVAARLTSREREIVQLLAEGKTCRQAADMLGLSFKTADTHRSKIMRKLNIHSVRDLVVFAIRNNIVQVVDPGSQST